MAAKRNDELSSKKLRPKARIEFLKRWHHDIQYLNPNAEDTRARQIRSILISQAYLTKLCRKNNYNNPFILWIDSFKYDARPSMFKIRVIFHTNKEQETILIMRLFKPNSMRLVFKKTDLTTSTRVSKFIRLCKAIKESTTLKKIDLHILTYDPVFVPILSDLLPDKIVKFEGCTQSLRNFMRRKCIMDRVEIKRASQETDYAMIFKAKAKVIHFARKYKLIDLSRFNNLQPNPIIEEVHSCVRFVQSDGTMPTDKWIREYLPKYRQAFTCLKSVNPNIELVLSVDFSSTEPGLSELELIMNHARERSDNIRALKDMANEMDIKIKSITF